MSTMLSEEPEDHAHDRPDANEHPHDLRHDPWLTCAAPRLIELAADIFADLEAQRPESIRKPRADALRRRQHVSENLIANLATLALRHEGRQLMISARNEALSPHYDRRDFPRQVVTEMVGRLEAVGLVSRRRGFRYGPRTAIRPTAAFLRRMAWAKVRATDIGMMPGGETLILKAPAATRLAPKPLVEYRDNTETRRMRDEMERINAFLNAAGITVDGEPLAPFRLTRQFLLSAPDAPHTFDRHGRIYDGPWINMHRAERYRLQIAGEDLADLDFTAMFTQLAYLQAGVERPVGDPYDGLPGLELRPDDPRHDVIRQGIKRGLNAFYFRKGWMTRLPVAVKRALGPEWTATRFAAALRQRHAPIKHLFGTGLGLSLTFTESRILVNTLLDLMAQNVPALPVHDGIMVPGSKQELALDAMRRGSRSIVGVELPVRAKLIPRPTAHSNSAPNSPPMP